MNLQNIYGTMDDGNAHIFKFIHEFNEISTFWSFQLIFQN
jgi:hypothetical protein